MALAIFSGSSSISTTSAASMAASEPMAPMAMPISARRQHRGVVDAVAHKGQLLLFGFWAAAALPPCPPCRRAAAGCSTSIHAQLPGHLVRATASASPVSMTVLRTPALSSAPAQPASECGLYHVGDHDVAGVVAVDGHVDDGAHAVAGDVGCTPSRSISLSLPAATWTAVHCGDDAVAADLLDVGHPAAVEVLCRRPSAGSC